MTDELKARQAMLDSLAKWREARVEVASRLYWRLYDAGEMYSDEARNLAYAIHDMRQACRCR